MLRSRANTFMRVRQVAQRTAGRKTAGIDGEVALTSKARAEVAVRVHATIRSWKPRYGSVCRHQSALFSRILRPASQRPRRRE